MQAKDLPPTPNYGTNHGELPQMRTNQHQTPQRPPGLPPVRGVGHTPIDIRQVPSRVLIDKFEHHIRLREMARTALDHRSHRHHRTEANIIWRELKLRLLPTNSNGSPRS